jgi:hypothetical protein
MMDHEYSLLGGVNRAKVGKYIARIAAIVSAGIVLAVLWIVDVAKALGLPANIPPSALSLLGAGVVYAVLYWLFNRYIWRWGRVGSLLKVPNLAGEWHCVGQTLTSDGAGVDHEWVGTVVLLQTWDKIRVRLKTERSGSHSTTAAIVYDASDGHRLLYTYRNEPGMAQSDLRSHHGSADMVFAADLKSAEGSYFNGHGRFTFGTMRWTRT